MTTQKTPAPTEFKRLGPSGIQVTWQDGSVHQIASEALRRQCPCATCRESRGDTSHGTPLTPQKPSLLKVIQHSKDEELRLDSIWPIGQYALGIQWGDGHNTGIYTYAQLFEMGLVGRDL